MLNRRQTLGSLAAAATVGSLPPAVSAAEDGFRLAAFAADVTPQVGMPQYSGGYIKASAIDDPLLAKGLVLLGGDLPIVLVAVDWCEIRNEAYARWRSVLAEAAGTKPSHVFVASLHQHDTPLGEIAAQKILATAGVEQPIVDLDFHEACVQRVADAIRDALGRSAPVTHYAIGQGKVEQVASTRRVVLPDGKITFGRYSRTTDAVLQSLPDGDIDPFLKTLQFFNGDKPLAAISAYATHPMSYYGTGRVSCEFVGLARERMQKQSGIHQVYFSGCAGDVTAGKYNDGTTANRHRLAERVLAGMTAAAAALERRPLRQLIVRCVPVVLPHREGPGLSVDECQKILADTAAPHARRATAAMLLSSRARNAQGHALDIQAVDFGGAQFLLMPAESFVGHQLRAQKFRPDNFVLTSGYGECAPGYIPTAQDIAEGFVREHGYSYAADEADVILSAAMKEALDVTF